MLALAFLVLVAYVQCVNYPFVYDDLSGIQDDSLISHSETLAQASGALLQPLRPLTEFTYALTHVFFGFSKSAFHVTNLIIHLLNTFLVFSAHRSGLFDAHRTMGRYMLKSRGV